MGYMSSQPQTRPNATHLGEDPIRMLRSSDTANSPDTLLTHVGRVQSAATCWPVPRDLLCASSAQWRYKLGTTGNLAMPEQLRSGRFSATWTRNRQGPHQEIRGGSFFTLLQTRRGFHLEYVLKDKGWVTRHFQRNKTSLWGQFGAHVSKM